MLLHSLNGYQTTPAGTAAGSQSTVQHLPGNLNTAQPFASVLTDALSSTPVTAAAALPGSLRLPPLDSSADMPEGARTSHPANAAQPGPHGKPVPARELTAAETEKIHTTAQQLEGLLLFQMLKQMWDAIPESSLLPAGNAGQMYREMWLEQVSKQASEAGGGIGVAKVVEQQLVEQARHTFTPEQAAALRQAG
jgi:hypothetical protein